ncbi:MAG: rhomboid family intramembrane serine protease [Crocinitomicaceae bacterium]|jgi:membrane associated rhomboid family serine protease
MQGRNLIQEFKYQLKSGTMTNRLIIVNVCVFLLILILKKSFLLYKIDATISDGWIHQLFDLNSAFPEFIRAPWGLVTSIFTHEQFGHLLFNMLFLYFSGRFFEQYFSRKKLWLTYLFGGVFGGILEIVAHNLFPALQGTNVVIIGASGSIMAIFTALAFYQPNLQVQLFGIFPIRIYFLALFFLFKDLINIGTADQIAHFAHLGGALFGLLSIQNLHSKKNILTRMEAFSGRLKGMFGTKKQAKPTRTRFKTDEEFNVEKRQKQERMDQILDKISKSGYDSLTKAEKDFLFNQSKNG